MEDHVTRRSRWRRGRDERGATFVLTAICMTLLLWGGAMGVDIGFTVTSSQAGAGAGRHGRPRHGPLHQPGRHAKDRELLLVHQRQAGQRPVGQQRRQRDVHGHGRYWSPTAPVGWTIPARRVLQADLLHVPSPVLRCWSRRSRASPTSSSAELSSVTRSALAAVTPEDGFSVGSYLASLNSQQSGVSMRS